MRREHSGHSRVTLGGQARCRAWWEGMWHTGLTSAREGGAEVWELVEIEGRGLGTGSSVIGAKEGDQQKNLA